MKLYVGDRVRILRGARKESEEVVDRQEDGYIILRGIPGERFHDADLQLIERRTS